MIYFNFGDLYRGSKNLKDDPLLSLHSNIKIHFISFRFYEDKENRIK